MDGIIRLSTKDAILYVSEHYDISSMYRVAKELSGAGLKVTTTQISKYLNGTRMSRKVADRFEEVYEVTISDVYDTAALRKNYTKGM